MTDRTEHPVTLVHHVVLYWSNPPCYTRPSDSYTCAPYRVTLAHHTVLFWSITPLYTGPSHRVTLAHHTVLFWSITPCYTGPSHRVVLVYHTALHWPITPYYTGPSHRVTLVHQTVTLAHHRVALVLQTVTLAYHTVLHSSFRLLYWLITPCYSSPSGCYTGLLHHVTLSHPIILAFRLCYPGLQTIIIILAHYIFRDWTVRLTRACIFFFRLTFKTEV